MPVILRWLLRLGPLNPIAVRLVQGGSRRRRHLYIRAAYLGALILALLYLLLLEAGGTGTSLTYRGMASAASSAFEFVAYLQIALICLLAPVFMAGAIAQEANPRTWDILLTTPMSASEIVLGNLFGRLFFILALLFASLPLFALTQYFGGVPGVSIFGSYAIAASAALLVGALAIALSVSRLVGKRAVFAFYIGVVSYLAITWAADKLTRGFTPTATYVSWMTALNPFLSLEALLNPSNYMRFPEGSQIGPAAWFLEKPVTTWCSLSCGLSFILMLASTITVRAGGLAGIAGGSERVGPPWYRKIFGLGAKGSEHRAPRQVWNNPIAWREAAARNATFGRMVARWSFIGIGALWGLSAVLYFHFSGMRPDTFRTVIMTTVIGELAVVTLVALNMSATAVSKEREDGTLDLLLTTPITPAAYLGGKVRGMVAYLLPLLAVPVGTLLLAGVYVLLAMSGMFKHPVGVEIAHALPTTTGSGMTTIQIPAVLPEAGIVLAIITVPFIAFCCMVGLSWSLKSKGTIGSVVSTVGVVGVIAGIVGMCAFQSGRNIAFVGPVLTALSPATAAFAGIFVEGALAETINTTGAIDGARLGLLIGSLVSAGIWIGLVYGLRANMTHNFDMTVRRLAGTA
jgi:ABC-type transport system involved in multi-copper enzyme maturation permease subunit